MLTLSSQRAEVLQGRGASTQQDIMKHVKIQSFDNYMLVISLASRQGSEDLKHLIIGNGLPKLQG